MACLIGCASLAAQPADAPSAPDELARAAEGRSFDAFVAALDRARTAVPPEVLHIYLDLRDVWAYANSDLAGAFFDDASSNGKVSELMARYPEYRAFIEPYAVRARGGRILYPTAETRRFLAGLAKQRRPATQPALIPPMTPATTQVPAPMPMPTPAAAPIPKLQPSVAQPVDKAIGIAAVPDSPPVPSCAESIVLEHIELTSTGLVVRGSGPLAARIAGVQTVAEAGLGSFASVTIEIPFASIGTAPSRVTSNEGPFASLRAVRYQTANDCGVRIRLDAREAAQWQVTPVDNGVSIGPPRGPEATAVTGSQAGERSGGSLRARGTFFGAAGEGKATGGSEIQLGVASDVLSFGTLRGFFSQSLSRRRAGDRYGGIGLSGLSLAGSQLDIGLGDVNVPLTVGSSTSINSVLVRGAAAALSPSDRTALTIFGGRAASPLIERVLQTRQTRGLSHDHVFGAGWNRYPAAGQFGFAAAVVRGVPQDGGVLTNSVGAVETPAAHMVTATLSGDYSIVDIDDSRQTGYALTFEPRASAAKFALGGFYRYTSPHYHPPLSSSFFASLRHAYTLFASCRPNDRFSAAGSLAQSKVFSLFDPPSLGTLTTSSTVSLSYALRKSLGVSAGYAEATAISDPGVLLAANSKSTSASGGIFGMQDKFGYGLNVARIETRDFTNGANDYRAGEIGGSISYADPWNHQWFLRAHHGRAKRANGTPAGGDDALTFGVHSPLGRGTLRVEAGYEATPAGLTSQNVEQIFGTLSYTPPASNKTIDGTVQLTVQSARVDSLPRRTVVALSMSAGHLLEWGSEPQPLAPYESRALTLGQRTSVSLPAMLSLEPFEDLNANGRMDAGEHRIAGIRFTVDGHKLVSDARGLAAMAVTGNSHELAVDATLAAQDYLLEEPLAPSIALNAGQRRTIPVPLLPGGRITGKLVTKEVDIDPLLLRGIRMTAKSDTASREVITDGDEFQFGLIPAGTYAVAIDVESVPNELRVSGDAVIRDLRIARGSRLHIAFTLRKATARERLGVAGSVRRPGT